MSVVCAKVYKDRIEVAADSIVVRGSSKDTKGDFSKMTKINKMIIGSTGDCDELSLLWLFSKTHRPEAATERDVLSFFAEFSRWKRDEFDNPVVSNNYLFAYDGKLFYVQGFFVYEIRSYAAIGAGQDFANAAMYLGHSPKEAVKVSCELSCFVAEPIIEEVMPT